MEDAWTKEQWKTALTAYGTDLETEAYRRLRAYLLGYAKYFLSQMRATDPYLQGLSERDRNDLAEQFTQETVLVVYEKASSFRGDAKATTYATTIMIRRIDRYLSRERTLRLEVARSDSQSDSDPAPLLESLPAEPTSIEGQNPEDMVMKEQLLETLDGCIQRLPSQQRSCWIERCVHERKVSDIASELGISMDAVYQNVHRARRALVECLEEQGLDVRAILA